MSSSIGKIFRVSTWGESHGGGVGVVVDGCPPNFLLNELDIQKELDRRRPGQSSIVTQRKEKDLCKIISGVFEGKTLGTPIAVLVDNTDARSDAYKNNKDTFRPSHADFTYEEKYGIRNWQGGGRASARETIARVIAGAIAKKVLKKLIPNLEVISFVEKVGKVKEKYDITQISSKAIETNPVRAFNGEIGSKMEAEIKEVAKKGDSIGGIVFGLVKNIPSGLGEPIFSKLEADLAKGMMSIPASKGFEVGSGFAGTDLLGSEHNDIFYVDENNNIRTKTNKSGGIQGGISNGENITFRVAFKPTATILIPQKTVTKDKREVDLAMKGRHDPCVLPRAVPIVESMVHITILDHFLRQKALRIL